MSVANFSNTMGCRRRARMRADHEASKKKEESSTTDSGWDSISRAEVDRIAAENYEREQEMIRKEQLRKEYLWSGKGWNDENLSLDEKRDMVADRLADNGSLCFLGWGGWDINSAPLGEEEPYYKKRKRVRRDAAIRFACGQGYKDIKYLRKLAKIHPEDQEMVDFLISRVREVDAREGMKPIEYMIAMRKRAKEGSGEKPKHEDVLERIGEEVMEANDHAHGKSKKKKK